MDIEQVHLPNPRQDDDAIYPSLIWGQTVFSQSPYMPDGMSADFPLNFLMIVRIIIKSSNP